jgi:Ni/Co efflux regulator RcnB
MKRLIYGLAAASLIASPVAQAQSDNHRDQRRGSQPYENERNTDRGQHRGWHKDRGHNRHWGRGERMGYNDWENARRIDYRRYNLRQPPRGYEWRGNDDRYFLVENRTGYIVSVIMIRSVRDRGDGYGWASNRGDSYRWGRGQRMGYNDWNDARRVDYRQYNLRQPPRGHEWRRKDDRFLLVAVATGLIAAVILTNGR